MMTAPPGISTSVARATLDAEGHVTSANQSFAALFNSDVDGVLGTHVITLCDPRESALVLSGFVRVVGRAAESVSIDLDPRVARTDQPKLRLSFTMIHSIVPGVADSIECTASDGSEQARAERRRQHNLMQQTRDVTQDSESGLPTQLGCEVLLSSAVRHAARTGSPVSLLRCDVDGIADLAQDYGAAVGRETANAYLDRFSQQLRSSDSVCLAQGDTFLVVAEDLGDEQDAAGVAYRLLSAAVEPVQVAGNELTFPMTIGIAIGDGTVTAGEMLAAAPLALEQAREDGSGGFRIIDLRPTSAA
jgi:diguanylate cyclase (GGDEF)-like protein